LVCLHRCATAATELLIERRREVRPILARAISRSVSSIAVEVRTAMTCSAGLEDDPSSLGRLREE
jgi:hypothetical protein